MRILSILFSMIMAISLVGGCASVRGFFFPEYSPPTVSGTDPTREDGCARLAGRQRLDCLKKLHRLCEQARNVSAVRNLLEEKREGRFVLKKYELCLVGNGGHRFACYPYHESSYKPTFFQYLSDYGIIGGAGAATGAALVKLKIVLLFLPFL